MQIVQWQGLGVDVGFFGGGQIHGPAVEGISWRDSLLKRRMWKHFVPGLEQVDPYKSSFLDWLCRSHTVVGWFNGVSAACDQMFHGEVSEGNVLIVKTIADDILVFLMRSLQWTRKDKKLIGVTGSLETDWWLFRNYGTGAITQLSHLRHLK